MNIFTWKDIVLVVLITTALGETIYIGALNYKFPKGEVLSEAVSVPADAITSPIPIESLGATPSLSPSHLALVDSIQKLASNTPSPIPLITASPIRSPVKTITPVVTPTPTSTPSPETPKPSLTPSPTPLLVSTSPTSTSIATQKSSSLEINSFIDRFAAQYGVDPNVMRHIAICESGFNPLAVHLSYYGLFQFGPSTWQNIRKKMGEDINTDLRLNAEEAVQTAAYQISIGGIGIWPNCKP